MKCIVAGSRDFSDRKITFEKLDYLVKEHNITEIVSGTAKGADTMGEQYAEENNIPVKEFPADWNQYGKGAGHIRNGQMAEYSDMAVIFWDGVSRGTKDMISKMKKIKKPCVIILYTEKDLDEW